MRALAVLLAALATASPAPASPGPDPRLPLFWLEHTGGRVRDSSYHLKVALDGHFTYTSGRDVVTQGQIPPAHLQGLRDAMKSTDFAKMHAIEASASPPMIYDAPETAYYFNVGRGQTEKVTRRVAGQPVVAKLLAAGRLVEADAERALAPSPHPEQ